MKTGRTSDPGCISLGMFVFRAVILSLVAAAIIYLLWPIANHAERRLRLAVCLGGGKTAFVETGYKSPLSSTWPNSLAHTNYFWKAGIDPVHSSLTERAVS